MHLTTYKRKILRIFTISLLCICKHFAGKFSAIHNITVHIVYLILLSSSLWFKVRLDIRLFDARNSKYVYIHLMQECKKSKKAWPKKGFNVVYCFSIKSHYNWQYSRTLYFISGRIIKKTGYPGQRLNAQCAFLLLWFYCICRYYLKISKERDVNTFPSQRLFMCLSRVFLDETHCPR